MTLARGVSTVLGLVALVALVAGARPAEAQNTLRVVMHSDLKIVDPIWTTAYIVRNHGYMIYDTLFAMDAKGEIKPQMVDRYDVSADKLTYTMTLRDGLLWHDGKPVSAEDCVASIKRWAAKDSMGQKMISFVQDLQVVGPKTFKIVLKEPTGLVLSALGKPSSNVPFMMPKRVAETDPNTQISDFTGSGPFVFRKEEWKPGDKAVIGDKQYYKVCQSLFPCGTPLESRKGFDGSFLVEPNVAKARALLQEAGYDGTTIVLMHSTDLVVLNNLAPVAKSLLERAGFKVDMQSMDWQTLVSRRAKKDPPTAGGWHAFLTSWWSADILNPVMTGFLNSACDKAMFGWPCDEQTEQLRDQFARETDPGQQKAIAEAVQVRLTQYPTHTPPGPGDGAVAVRKNVTGMAEAPVTASWTVRIRK